MKGTDGIFRRLSLKIVIIYLLISIFWIIISDVVLFEFDLSNYFWLSALKGIMFVIGTGFLLYILLERYMNGINARERELYALNKHLEESERMYRSLIENNIDGICFIDINGKILETNEATEKITGYSQAELEKKSIWSLINKTDLKQFIYHFDLAREGTSLVTEIKGVRKNRRTIILSIKDVPIIVNGEIIGFFLIMKDITEQKKNEEYMRKSEKLSVVGELASSVAHEIRNPLTSIKGFLQIFQQEEHYDKLYIDIMLSEIDRINFIVGELMILANPQVSNYQEKDMKKLIENVIVLLQTLAIIKNSNIETDFEPQEILINCEENKVKQVFINILKNAIEAIKDNGRVKVKIKKDLENHLAVIRIVDNGYGISKEILTKLGEPFYTTKEKGTGLGLMVSFKIIQEHNGRIVVKSKENLGTIVEVSLPLSD